MNVRLYNTLTGQKEPFEPADPKHARVYVCGPTVYDYAHLGHARCYVVYDVLVRHLRSDGLAVTYVRNITDVDDKILKRAAETGTEPTELATRFAAAYSEDMHRLGNLDPDIEPRVSTHLSDIFTLVQRLIDGGHAYLANGDVYFSVESFPEYGKLSHRDLSKMKVGASDRLDDKQTARKRHPADFALWKRSEDEAERRARSNSWKNWHFDRPATSLIGRRSLAVAHAQRSSSTSIVNGAVLTTPLRCTCTHMR